MTANAPMVEIQGLVKNYQALRPLRLTSLVLHPGEAIAIGGIDKAGAELLVNLINGAILPDEGEVRIFGRQTTSITNETEWFATLDRLGIVTERAVLLEGATVEQNLALPFTLELDAIPADIRSRTTALADRLGLDTAALAQSVAEVGPAVRMRIHLGRAIAHDPDVLLLEHPSLSLRREDVAAFARTIVDVSQGRETPGAVLLLTEDEELVRAVGARHFRLQPATGALVESNRRRGWRKWFS
jgi:ABC-type transporter Mla maintaining outer membrane lipid asymmetry ATPase subunit MlaF